MTFLRVFTFVGYSRALRISLLLGGCVYYFMPDLSPGRIDDGFFIVVPALIIVLRVLLKRRSKKKARENESPSTAREPSSRNRAIAVSWGAPRT
jgi:hypothetical protein